MNIPRISIVLIFLFGMLTGCRTPLVDVHVDVRSGVQPGTINPPGPGPGCPPGTPWYLCSGGGCPPGTPWYLCSGGGVVDKGVLKKIFDTDERKVYVVEIKEQDQWLYFSVPPDEVEPGLKENDEVAFTFKHPKNKLAKVK